MKKIWTIDLLTMALGFTREEARELIQDGIVPLRIEAKQASMNGCPSGDRNTMEIWRGFIRNHGLIPHPDDGGRDARETRIRLIERTRRVPREFQFRARRGFPRVKRPMENYE